MSTLIGRCDSGRNLIVVFLIGLDRPPVRTTMLKKEKERGHSGLFWMLVLSGLPPETGCSVL